MTREGHMGEINSYITVDVAGVKRVGGTRISLDSVVIAFQQGQSAEEIQRNFPVLGLEQVYGAITHYLAHREQVDQYLRQQRETWEQSKAQAVRNPSPAVERLRKMRAGQFGLT